MIRISFVIALLSAMLLCSSCAEDNDKINGKYTIIVDGGIKRLIGDNLITNRNNIYPNIVDVVHDNRFILIKQLPSKQHHIDYMGFDIYNIYCSYSKYLNDSTQNKSWGGLVSDSTLYRIFKSRGASVNNESADIRIYRSVADSLVTYGSFYKKVFVNDTNYWVIYSPTDTLIGPLTKEEYAAKRNELNIPDGLQIE